MQDMPSAARFPCALVNVFLALLILLMVRTGDFCRRQFRLAHFGQCAVAQVCSGFLLHGTVHSSYLQTGEHPFRGRAYTTSAPEVGASSPQFQEKRSPVSHWDYAIAQPVHISAGTAVIRIGCLACEYRLLPVPVPCEDSSTGSQTCQNSAVTQFKAAGNLAHQEPVPCCFQREYYKITTM